MFVLSYTNLVSRGLLPSAAVIPGGFEQLVVMNSAGFGDPRISSVFLCIYYLVVFPRTNFVLCFL
jgi:hypothetical protein